MREPKDLQVRAETHFRPGLVHTGALPHILPPPHSTTITAEQEGSAAALLSHTQPTEEDAKLTSE